MREPVVYIVDDDVIATAAMRKVVEGGGYKVNTYPNALEFLQAYSPQQRGCLLLDLRMPDISGLELQQELAKREATMPIIFVTGCGDIQSAVRAMKAEALDFLIKPVNTELLIETIHHALKQDAATRERRTRTHEIREREQRLTRREREVMGLVVAGQSTKEVAQTLGISPNTVEIHRYKIMRKMQAGSVAELVNMAHECELASSP